MSQQVGIGSTKILHEYCGSQAIDGWEVSRRPSSDRKRLE